MASPDTRRRGRDDQRLDTTLITSGRADGHPALAPTLYPTTTFVTESVASSANVGIGADVTVGGGVTTGVFVTPESTVGSVTGTGTRSGVLVHAATTTTRAIRTPRTLAISPI